MAERNQRSHAVTVAGLLGVASAHDSPVESSGRLRACLLPQVRSEAD